MRTKTLLILGILMLTVLFAAAAVRSGQAGTDFDILIVNGRIIDGTGNPWFAADVGIVGDRIAAVGRLAGRSARRLIDAGGMIVSPGFIDMHTHCDSGLAREETKANANYVSQGVTTVVTGNCGFSMFPVGQILAQWKKGGIGTNAVLLLGLGTVRHLVMGNENRAPTADELDRMKVLVRTAMAEGAFGVSTGLQYIPGKFTSTEELIELTRVAAEAGGFYTSHMRSEEEKLIEAVREVIRIGEAAGVRVNISHFKASARPNWGSLKEAIRLVDEARARGLEITADIYPYNKSVTTSLRTIFNIPSGMKPFAAIEKKMSDPKLSEKEREALDAKISDALAEALKDPVRRQKIKKLTLEGDPGSVNWVAKGGWLNFTIMDSRTEPSFVGKMFCDLATDLKKEEFDIAADLYIKEKDNLQISLSAMLEDDVRAGLSQRWSMISSDGSAVAPGEKSVHPRAYGSFPRVLGKYSRDERLFPLEDAVRKMTSLPAQLLRLRDRGLLREGFKADIVVFNPQTIKDEATYLKPHQYASGIVYVLINGGISVESGKMTGALNGEALIPTYGGK